MNRYLKIALAALVFVVAPICLAGCSTPAAKTGFLKDYSKLTPHPDIDGRHRYINPNMSIGNYSKFIVDPVAVNLSAEAKERDMDPEKLNELAQYFHEQIVGQHKKVWNNGSWPE